MSLYNGLSLVIWHPAEFQAEYGRCTDIRTAAASVVPPANSHPMLSIVQLILAIVSELLHAFCLLSIRKHLQMPCYKMLFFIGVVDMLGLVVGAIQCSVLALAGATFCDFPLTQYVAGGLAMAFWFAETSSELFLAFNRCFALLLPKIDTILFKENRTWFLMGLPTFYALFSWFFTRPLIFSTSKFAFFLSPYEDYNSTAASSMYSNWSLTFNNTLVVGVLCATYGLFCLFWVGRTLKTNATAKAQPTTAEAAKDQKQSHGNENGEKQRDENSESKATQMIFLQVFLISLLNVCAAGLAVCVGHFETFPEMIVIGQFAYVLTLAAPPFVYLSCNCAVRADIRSLLHRIFTGNGFSSATVVAQRNDGQISGLIGPTHTKNVGTARANGTVSTVPIVTDHLSILNNGVPLFRRPIAGAGNDAASGHWQMATTSSAF